MRLADRRPATSGGADAPGPSGGLRLRPTSGFVVLTAAFLLVFSATSPFYLESAGVLALAGFIARAAAALLSMVGVGAQAAGNVLWTSRGGFLVTQECIFTPVIPIYLAAICAYSPTMRRFTLGILATLPLFTALGIARLLVVALPDAMVTSSAFMVHAFYQLVVGAVVVFLAARWRHTGHAAVGRRALAGLVVGVLFVELF